MLGNLFEYYLWEGEKVEILTENFLWYRKETPESVKVLFDRRSSSRKTIVKKPDDFLQLIYLRK